MGDGHSKLETLAAAPAAGGLAGAGASAAPGEADVRVELLVEKEVKVTSGSAVLHSNGGDKVETTTRVEETEVERVAAPADGGQDEKDGAFAGEEVDDAAGGGDEDEDDEVEEEFFAGDFVWVKVKSYPWWPGQVFDAADASEAARRVQRKDRRLVACFGDGTFAWCYPFQMKSFEEDFGKFSRQSSSKNFTFAVEKALVEFGRCVEEEMACPCLEPRPKLVKPYVLNAGIREGATVPDGRIKSHSFNDFVPADFVSEVRGFGRGLGVGDALELAVLKSRLSAFYYAKGYGDLTEYYDPVVEGISDEEGDGLVLEEKAKVNVGGGHGGGGQRLVLDRPDFADDKVHQRKKQRSMAELMAENVGHEAANHKPDTSSKSRKKKKVDLHVSLPSDGKGGIKSASSPGAKKPKKAPPQVPEEEEQEDEKPSEDESEDAVGREEEEELILSSPRQRKRSKYLSPPYTMLGVRSVSMKKDVEGATETDGAATPKDVGDGKVDAPSEASKDNDPQKKASACSTPRTPKGKRRGVAAANMDVGEQHAQQQDIAAGELLSDLNTAAANPTHKKAGDSSDSIKAFFQKFRSSSYKESSQMAACNAKQPEKHDSDDEKLVPGAEQDGTPGPKKRKAKDEPSPRRKPKKAANLVDPPNGSRAGTSKEATTQEGKQAALLLTFSPGSTHPSKEELIKVFGEFGKLNEADTEVVEDAACARVVFLKAADGEKAFYGSDKISVLGHSVASYRLRYLSASSATAPASEPTSHPSAGGAAAGGAPLACIKINLESMMTTLTEPGCGEQLPSEVRSSLTKEIGGLLKKVNNLLDPATPSLQ